MKADGHAFWARLLSQEKHWRTLRSPGSDFWIGFQESWVTADAPDSPLTTSARRTAWLTCATASS